MRFVARAKMCSFDVLFFLKGRCVKVGKTVASLQIRIVPEQSELFSPPCLCSFPGVFNGLIVSSRKLCERSSAEATMLVTQF